MWALLVSESYLSYLDLYMRDEITAFSKFRKDPELTYVEKELFEVRLIFRKKEWLIADEKLEKCKTENAFYKAERYFLMASSQLIQNNYEESIQFGNLALRFYEDCEYQEGLFKTLYNISIAHNRIGMDKLADYFLIQAEKNVITNNQKLIIARARACSFSRNCQFDQAVKVLKSVENHIDESSKFEAEQFKICAADIYYRAGYLDRSLEMIEDVMSVNSARERGRALFYYHIINFINDNRFLPKKPDAIRSLPDFNLKWDIIELIQDGEVEVAKKYWSHLVKRFPKFYAEDFICIDKSQNKGPFEVLIKKLVSHEMQKHTIDIDTSLIKGTKMKTLIEVLLSSKTPIRKEILIEKIWEEEYSPKMDARFYKLVERAKQNLNIELKNSHNAYFLAS